jgi:hypothetical protein
MHPVCMAYFNTLMRVAPRETRDNDGYTPLLYVIHIFNDVPMKSSAPLMKHMIQLGSNPSVQTRDGYTLLHLCALNPDAYIHTMLELMDSEVYGIDWTLKNSDGKDFVDVARAQLNGHRTSSFMHTLCSMWKERCITFARQEVGRVIRVKSLVDIVMQYLDTGDVSCAPTMMKHQ